MRVKTKKSLVGAATAAAIALCGAAGCDEEPKGRFHEAGCNPAYINEDFLEGDLSSDWTSAPEGNGLFVIEDEGTGANREGWLTITAEAGSTGLSATDTSAFRVIHVAPSANFRLRALLTAPATASGAVTGIIAQENESSFVAVVLRGNGSGLDAELLGVSEGAEVFSSQVAAPAGAQPLVEITRDMNTWSGAVSGETLTGGDLELNRQSLDVGVFLASAPMVRVEWIEACPYLRELD